jgi:hypothetical protein
MAEVASASSGWRAGRITALDILGIPSIIPGISIGRY